MELRAVQGADEREVVKALLRSEFEVGPGVGVAFAKLYDDLLDRDPIVVEACSRVAVEEGRVVGHALYAPRTLRIAGCDVSAALIGLVVVAPDCRGEGVGGALIQDVERAILELYEGLALAPGQATGGNRGGNEDMTVHAVALPDQPEVGAYVGTYQRPPIGTVTVGAEDGHLVLRGGGADERDIPLVFWGPDLTYTAPRAVAGYPYEGMPVEFIRNIDGNLGWIRINGRIAVKDT